MPYGQAIWLNPRASRCNASRALLFQDISASWGTPSAAARLAAWRCSGNAPRLVHRQRLGLCGRSRASFYYFFMVFVVIAHKTKATAGRALAFIVRIFVNDTIAIAVWTSFHAIAV